MQSLCTDGIVITSLKVCKKISSTNNENIKRIIAEVNREKCNVIIYLIVFANLFLNLKATVSFR